MVRVGPGRDGGPGPDGRAVGAAILAHTAGCPTGSVTGSPRPAPPWWSSTAALVDQETGVRGYLLSGDERFLEPYTRGVADERTLLARIRQLLAGEPVALRRPRPGRGAGPELARPRGRPVDRGPPARRRAGGRAVDAVLSARRRSTRFGARIGDPATGTSPPSGTRPARTSSGRAGCATACSSAWSGSCCCPSPRSRCCCAWGAASRWTGSAPGCAGSPAASSTTVTVRGPADLARLAGDVETMRRRIVDELTASQQARAQLEQQAAELQPLQRRAGAVRLRRLARPAGAAAQGRRSASCCSAATATSWTTAPTVHRLRGRRRQPHAGADQRPAGLLPGRPAARPAAPVDLTTCSPGRGQSRRPRSRSPAPRSSGRPLPTVPGDPTLLTMLWQNLIGNALKFRGPDRPPRGPDHGRARRAGGGSRVADNGIGIDPQYAEQDLRDLPAAALAGDYSGTGIGLALCKKIVEFHGGEIRLDTPTTTAPGSCSRCPWSGRTRGRRRARGPRGARRPVTRSARSPSWARTWHGRGPGPVGERRSRPVRWGLRRHRGRSWRRRRRGSCTAAGRR